MATIVSSLFISLDGVVEVDPEWHFPYFDERWAPRSARTTRASTCSCSGGSPTRASRARGLSGRPPAGWTRGSPRSSATCGRSSRRGQDRDLGWRNAEPLRGNPSRPSRRSRRSRTVEDPRGGVDLRGPAAARGRAARRAPALRAPDRGPQGRAPVDEGDGIYPLRLLRSQVFPTGVARLVYAPSSLPGGRDLRRRHGGYPAPTARAPSGLASLRCPPAVNRQRKRVGRSSKRRTTGRRPWRRPSRTDAAQRVQRCHLKTTSG